MGLDMYLRKENYMCTYDFDQQPYSHPKKVNVVVDIEYEDGHKKTVQLNDDINDSGGLFIQTPFAYWRKANSIHRWFLTHLPEGDTDRCQPIPVTGKELLKLVDLCKEVLADHDKAEELLPTQEGFFFGTYEYDEWYFQDLENTIRQLKDVKEEDDFIYQASW